MFRRTQDEYGALRRIRGQVKNCRVRRLRRHGKVKTVRNVPYRKSDVRERSVQKRHLNANRCPTNLLFCIRRDRESCDFKVGRRVKQRARNIGSRNRRFGLVDNLLFTRGDISVRSRSSHIEGCYRSSRTIGLETDLLEVDISLRAGVGTICHRRQVGFHSQGFGGVLRNQPS